MHSEYCSHGAKKNELKPHLRKVCRAEASGRRALRECWVISPEQDADFVAAMEDVLEVYHRPDENASREQLQSLQEILEQKLDEIGKLIE